MVRIQFCLALECETVVDGYFVKPGRGVKQYFC